MLDECIMDGKHHERALDYVIMRRQFLKEHDLPESPLRALRAREKIVHPSVMSVNSQVRTCELQSYTQPCRLVVEHTH